MFGLKREKIAITGNKTQIFNIYLLYWWGFLSDDLLYVGETIKKVLKDRIRLLGGTFFKKCWYCYSFSIEYNGKTRSCERKNNCKKTFGDRFLSKLNMISIWRFWMKIIKKITMSWFYGGTCQSSVCCYFSSIFY